MPALFSYMPPMILRLVAPGFSAARPALAAFKFLAIVVSTQAALASSARATCGDWLAHPGETHVAGAQSPLNKPSASSTTPTETASRAPSTPEPRPCNGPFCGRAPIPPAAPTPIQSLPGHDQLGHLIGALFGDLAEHEEALTSAVDVAPRSGFVRPIEHPPRA